MVVLRSCWHCASCSRQAQWMSGLRALLHLTRLLHLASWQLQDTPHPRMCAWISLLCDALACLQHAACLQHSRLCESKALTVRGATCSMLQQGSKVCVAYLVSHLLSAF